MNFEFQIIDAFVDPSAPLSGNPAAVVILPDEDSISDQTRGNIAAEFNLSETVFLAPVSPNDEQTWSIRWFTPKCEVQLCGHATVAASHFLFKNKIQSKHLKYKSAFQKKLEAQWDSNCESVILDFPLNDCRKIEKADWLEPIKQAVVGSDNLLNQIVDVQLSDAVGKLLIRIKDGDTDGLLQRIQPNFEKLLEINVENRFRGIIVTQKSANITGSNAVHFRSRYFAPWVGIQEDPVTGSAHTVLTPYWSRIYRSENNIEIEEFSARQGSKRTGMLRCRLSKNNDRVLIKGIARTFCRGMIEIPK